HFNRFRIPELAGPWPIDVGADGTRHRTAFQALRINPADLGLGPADRVGDTTWVADVVSWKGRVLDPDAVNTAPIWPFRHEEGTARHQYEDPAEVLDHLFHYAWLPQVTVEQPVDPNGQAVAPETLVQWIRGDERTWAEGIVFPQATCNIRRLRLTDRY